MDDNKLLYKSSEVSKMLGITTATLKKLVKTGKISCITVNTHRYFTKDQVNEYIQSHITNAGDEAKD